MTILSDLQTARENFAAQLASISASPKPTYDIDGQKVSWTEHYKFIRDSIRQLDEDIEAEKRRNDGPYEVLTEFFP